jgi:zinc transport system permease protein
LLVVGLLGLASLLVVGLLYRPLLAATVDEDAARVSGIKVTILNVALAGLTGVTIAISMRIVGILLIAALMVLPVIAAGRLAGSIRSTIALSMGIGLASVLVGLAISYYGDLAPGGAIVLLAAAVTVVSVGAGAVRQGS